MARPVRAVLADLDDTLFDHAHATKIALAKLQAVEPALAAWPLAVLERRHNDILEELHADVLAARRTLDAARVERFLRLLRLTSADRPDERAAGAARVYRRTYQEHWQPVPG